MAVSADPEVVQGGTRERYRALAPFFFLEDGWAGLLGAPREVAVREAMPEHILTILAVRDLARSVEFYRRAFGWPVRIEVPVLVEFELPDGRGLGLYEREGFGRNTGQIPEMLPEGTLAGTELYLRVVDLARAIERLEGVGARLLSARAARPWGDEAAYYADPDGNVLVVARPVDRPPLRP